MDPGLRVDLDADLRIAQVGHLQQRGRVGRQAEVLRVQAQQQVGHDRVAADRRVGDLAGVHAAALGHLVDQAVDGAQHARAQFLQALRGAGVVDPADHVQAAGDLVVVVALRRDDLGDRQVDQLHGDRRGADVNGDGIMPEGGVAGLDVDDVEPPGVAHEGGGHLALGRAQRVGQLAEAEEGVVRRAVCPSPAGWRG